MTKIKKYPLYCIIFLLVVLVSILTLKCCQEPKNEPNQVIIHDTLTEITYDTVYLDHYKTIKVQLHDTLNQLVYIDSVVVDSVYVDIPISKYEFDTICKTDTTTFEIMMKLSGYDVTLDTLTYVFKYTPTPVVVKKNFFKEHFKAGMGVSGGYGIINRKADIYVGAGFYFVF